MAAPSIAPAPPVFLGAVPVLSPAQFIEKDGIRYKITVLYRKAGLNAWEDISNKIDCKELATGTIEIYHDRNKPCEYVETVYKGNFNFDDPNIPVTDVQFDHSIVRRKNGSTLEETNYANFNELKNAQPLAEQAALVGKVEHIYDHIHRSIKPSYNMNTTLTIADTKTLEELRSQLAKMKSHDRPVFNALAHAIYLHDFRDPTRPGPFGYGETELDKILSDDPALAVRKNELKDMLKGFAIRTPTINVDLLLKQQLSLPI